MNIFPSDVVDRSEEILNDTASYSVGAYTHSQGFTSCRKHVANFINKRDGVSDATADNIFLTDGASPGVTHILRASVAGPEHGVLVPLPQYPLYSASIALLNGSQLGYYLEEEDDWGLNVEKTEEVILKAKKDGVTPRVLVIINPGNPTGQCLSEKTIKDSIELAKKYNMLIMADEVYQENIYGDRPFHSYRKVLHSMGSNYNSVELVSYHSTSKGIFGECGLRGGYMELCNIEDEGKEQIYKTASIQLCPNTCGQVTTGVMCNLPQKGEASY
eukprot:UN30767